MLTPLETEDSFQEALSSWFGNNGNEETENEFRHGWNAYLENTSMVKEVDYGNEYNKDYNAGVRAARNIFTKSSEKRSAGKNEWLL